MKLLIFIFIICLLNSCGGLDINQTVTTNYNYQNGTKEYTIWTAIHRRAWTGFSEECVYLKQRHNITQNILDSIKALDYKNAELEIQKYEDCFPELR